MFIVAEKREKKIERSSYVIINKLNKKDEYTRDVAIYDKIETARRMAIAISKKRKSEKIYVVERRYEGRHRTFIYCCYLNGKAVLINEYEEEESNV